MGVATSPLSLNAPVAWSIHFFLLKREIVRLCSYIYSFVCWISSPLMHLYTTTWAATRLPLRLFFHRPFHHRKFGQDRQTQQGREREREKKQSTYLLFLERPANNNKVIKKQAVSTSSLCKWDAATGLIENELFWQKRTNRRLSLSVPFGCRFSDVLMFLRHLAGMSFSAFRKYNLSVFEGRRRNFSIIVSTS